MAKDADGITLKVGMYVEFKSDIEQGGTVVAIRGNSVTVENKDGFSGDYIGGTTRTTVPADRCWSDC